MEYQPPTSFRLIMFDVTDWGDLDNISKETEQTVTNLIQQPLASDQTEQEPILNDDTRIILELYPNFTVNDVKAMYNRILKLQPDKGQYGTARIDYFKSVYDDAARQEQKNGFLKVLNLLKQLHTYLKIVKQTAH